MSMQTKLDQVLQRYNEINLALENAANLDQSEITKLAKEASGISKIADLIKKLRSKEKEKLDLELIIEEENSDPEIKKIANEEVEIVKKDIEFLNEQIKIELIPKDENDERNAIVEIRAGTGGDEAGLFAADLLRMYERYCAIKNWHCDVLNTTETGAGSLREAVLEISGTNVFSRLKFESGVHRVQRVPETEASGRIHTSAATVAVLPEAEDVDVVIDEKDLQIDVYRASGAGGQHVNKTESAIRVTHIPSGLVVIQQDDRSQHKNKAKALKILRTRLFDLENEKKNAERAANRKSQIGRGDRSERIRTYNFPQGRVTDHRINLTLYKLNLILEGEALDEIIDSLITEDQAQKISANET